MEVLLKFADNPKSVKLKINNNTVIYGLNGKGKTRILKAILALKRISNEQKNEEVANLVSDLNLEHLKINGRDYFEIFESSRYLKEKQDEMAKEFLKLEKSAIDFYFDKMRNSLPMIESNISMSMRRRITQSLRHGENLLRGRVSYEILSEYMLEIRYIRRNLKKFLIDNGDDNILDINVINRSNEIGYYVEDIIGVSEHLYREYNDFNKYVRSELPNENELSRERKLIRDSFADISITSISSFHDTEENIFGVLNRTVRILNSKILADSWSDKSDKGLKREIEDIKEKINLFNKYIANYTKITMKVNKEGYTLKKFNEVLEFIKLSSGERRLITIFINILFTDTSHILIDEPELSLSVDFQTRIVADLFETCKNRKLIIATHAPFIYDDFKGMPGSREIAL